MKTKTNLFRNYPLLILFPASLIIILVSWGYKQPADQFKQLQQTDTVPKEKKIRDLDDALRELDRVDMKIEMEKVQKELAEAMEKFDLNAAKMKIEIEKAMKDVDFGKIRKEVEESMAKVDWNKIKADIDFEKIQKEMKESMEKIDWDKMKKEMDEVRNIDMKKVELEMKKAKEEIEKIGPQLKEELEKAKVEIDKAKAEIKEYKEFVDGLEKDGLLNKKEDYSIKHKKGELTVNGKKVSAAIYNKYRTFLEKHKEFTIEKSNDDFNINLD